MPRSPSAGLLTQSCPSHLTGECGIRLSVLAKATFSVRPSGDSYTEDIYSVLALMIFVLCSRATMLWLLMTVTEPFNSSKLR